MTKPKHTHKLQLYLFKGQWVLFCFWLHAQYTCIWLVQVVFSGVIFYHITSVSFCNYVFSSFYSVLHTPKCTWTYSIYLTFIITSSASIHMLAISLTKQNFKLSVHVCSCHLSSNCSQFQSFSSVFNTSPPPNAHLGLTFSQMSWACDFIRHDLWLLFWPSNLLSESERLYLCLYDTEFHCNLKHPILLMRKCTSCPHTLFCAQFQVFMVSA